MPSKQSLEQEKFIQHLRENIARAESRGHYNTVHHDMLAHILSSGGDKTNG